MTEKQKIRKYRLGKKHSPETRQKISEAISGINNPNFSKTFSDDHRRKLSESQKIRRKKEKEQQNIHIQKEIT